MSTLRRWPPEEIRTLRTSSTQGAWRGVRQLPGLRQVQDLESRWQVELSLRYLF